MPRFHALAECVGQALREHGRHALTGAAPFGLDAATEHWRARQHARPELPERLLTLFHDPALHPPFRDHLPVFEKAHALASVTGLVPLRGYHADTEPPYLISEWLDGYDL